MKKYRIWDISAQEYLSKGVNPDFPEGESIYFPSDPNREGTTLGWAIENTQDYIVQDFSGLLDREGKEIYEGDLVIEWFHDNENPNALVQTFSKSSKIGIVEFDPIERRIAIKYKTLGSYHFTPLPYGIKSDLILVVGTIFNQKL